MMAPFVVSVVTAGVVGRVLPRGHGGAEHIVWWAAVLVSSTVAFLVSGRLCRRLLPPAALLKMTMLFPDQAPKRLKVAWRAGLTRELERSSHSEAVSNCSVPTAVAEGILALAASISRHDRRTRGHSERVRALTDLIADGLHLPTADRDRLRWSALLHDVGKLSVHPHILNKAGKPTEEEWAESRDHHSRAGDSSPPWCRGSANGALPSSSTTRASTDRAIPSDYRATRSPSVPASSRWRTRSRS